MILPLYQLAVWQMAFYCFSVGARPSENDQITAIRRIFAYRDRYRQSGFCSLQCGLGGPVGETPRSPDRARLTKILSLSAKAKRRDDFHPYHGNQGAHRRA